MKVFISYAALDAKIAKQLVKALRDIDVKTFLDQKDVLLGDDVLDRITEGLSEADALVVIISPASLTSSWVCLRSRHCHCSREESSSASDASIIELADLFAPAALQDASRRREGLFRSVGQARDHIFARHLVAARLVRVKETRSGQSEISRLCDTSNVTRCTKQLCMQLEDHSDNGYILVVEFDNSITSAAEVAQPNSSAF